MTPARMTFEQRDSLDAAIVRLQRSLFDTDDVETRHRLAQIDLLEQLLDRAIVTTQARRTLHAFER